VVTRHAPPRRSSCAPVPRARTPCSSTWAPLRDSRVRPDGRAPRGGGRHRPQARAMHATQKNLLLPPCVEWPNGLHEEALAQVQGQ
jgi:hypothetical protein